MMERQTQAARAWTLAETHTLLDLLRDTGFSQLLTRKGYQNWEVFERLSVLLGRCNIHVSSVEVKSHWQSLKVKFLSLKRLLDMGHMSGITDDFPFYEEMQQLLTPQSKIGSCKREADSSGLESQDFPSSFMSDYDQIASSSNQEASEDLGQAGETPPEDVPWGGVDISGHDVQRLVALLNCTAHRLMNVIERLEHLSRVEEQLTIQLSYMCSAGLQRSHQPYGIPSEWHFYQRPAHNLGAASSRTLRSWAERQRARRLVRHHP